jgi:TPR repeat protein
MALTRSCAVLRAAKALLAGVLVLLVCAGVATAETSSWSSRVDPAAPIEKSKKKPAAKPSDPVTVIKAVPVTPEGGQMPAPKSPPSAGGKAKAPAATADDPAYEAFDQGLYLTALELAVKAAERGEPQAHTLVGRIYSEGLGVTPNPPLAAQWFARGAQLGDPEAMFAYALMLAEGRGVDKDRAEAAKLFEAAAARRHPLANYNLALMFMRGDGKPENPYRAMMHMRYAAENGVVTAQYDLGTMYATGTGTDPNAFEAAKWIGKAATGGHVEAQLDYALILFRGHGVPPDPKRGAHFFRLAAEKGAATAQNRLARCYTHGAGVPQDLIEAAKWNYIARAGGIEDEALDKLLAKLSGADRAKARAAAQQWRDRISVGLE